jgi:hypothetical protein
MLSDARQGEKGKMNIKILLPARIEKGKLIFTDPVNYSKVISSLEGKAVVVNIKEPRSQRSKNQNDYYFGVVVEILAEHTGYSREEMHEVLKAKFLSETKELAGQSITFSRSTTSLSTVEFEEYLVRIREWASASLECFIPLPNEVDF